MTFSEMWQSPIGTTFMYVKRCKAGVAGREFKAVHWERMHKRVKPVWFYGDTAEAAMAKAEAHDKKRKELQAKWQRSALARRRGEIGRRSGKV